MQLIYKGKINQILLTVDFLDGFSLSANKTHYSNEEEALKFIDEDIPNIMNNYFTGITSHLNLKPDQINHSAKSYKHH